MNKPYEQKPNTGALFKNDEKKPDRVIKSPDGSEWILSDADYKGSANINGADFWVDATIKRSKAGKPYMALKFNPKQQHAKPEPKGLTADNWATHDFKDDDKVPF